MKYNIYNFLDSESDESYPDFFFEWDESVTLGEKPGFYEPDELTEIIEIYILNDEVKRAKQAINHALQIYPDDDELLYEILLLLNDYAWWNDLFTICDKYKEELDVWIDGHKLTALLHLGMEDETLILFRQLKAKYADDKEDLSIIYQAMGEALCDVDLFDSAIEIVQEAIDTLDEDINFYWLQIQSFVELNDKESVGRLADTILKLNSLDSETWYRLGVSFQEVGDLDKAIDAFEYAQSLGHDQDEILKNLIFVYEKNKNFNKALEKTKEFLKLYPDSYTLNLMAAMLNSQMENWDEALMYIDITLRIMPEISSLYLYKSNFLLRLEEYKKAKTALMDGLKNTKDLDGFLSRRLSKLNKQYPDY